MLQGVIPVLSACVDCKHSAEETTQPDVPGSGTKHCLQIRTVSGMFSDAGQDTEAGDATESDTEEDDIEDQEVRQAVDAQMARELPPGCLDVTTALQFLVDNSSITFHQVRLDEPVTASSRKTSCILL